jgi:uncharacterized protein with HEPN domain
MRHDEDCLREMVEAAAQLFFLMNKPGAERLLTEDRSFRHSVFFEFVVIGEGVTRLSSELKLRHPEVPWRQVNAFRHRIAHGYFEISLPIVWQLLQSEVPRLHKQLMEVISVEFHH